MLQSPVHDVLQSLDAASRISGQPPARLVAVSKTQPASAIRALAAELLQTGRDQSPAFGENYVQEALRKQAELADLTLEWHLIGHLQSNKASEAARAFHWVQSVDRPRLVEALARHRPEALPPLNVLIQVNIDDEASKHGCKPDQIASLAQAIATQPRLMLRGLMAIPAPRKQVDDDPGANQPRLAFRAMKTLHDTLAAQHPGVDTLSMGMSADYREAIEAGATMVRVGTALFGARG